MNGGRGAGGGDLARSWAPRRRLSSIFGGRARVDARSDLLHARVLRVEAHRAAVDDGVVAVERDVRGRADVGAVARAHLQLVLAGLVAALAREAEVEVGDVADLPARVGEVDLEALDRRVWPTSAWRFVTGFGLLSTRSRS